MSNPFIQTLHRGNHTIIRYIPQRSKRNRAYWRRQGFTAPYSEYSKLTSETHMLIMIDWLQHNIKQRRKVSR